MTHETGRMQSLLSRLRCCHAFLQQGSKGYGEWLGGSGSMYNRRFTQWMYRGQHPHALARLLNRIWATLASSGSTANYGLVTLEVTGRRSGRTVSLPVVVVSVEGQRYQVSMLGDNVQWVKNVRAAAGRAALRAGRREPILLEEVPIAQRAPILRAYLQRAPGARPHVPVDKDAPLPAFETIAGAYPVFRVTSLRSAEAEPA